MTSCSKISLSTENFFINEEFTRTPEGMYYKGYTAFIPSLSVNSDFSKPNYQKTICCSGCGKPFIARKRSDSQALVPCREYFIHCISECLDFLKLGTFRACNLCKKIFLSNRSYSAHRRSCQHLRTTERKDEKVPLPFVPQVDYFQSNDLNLLDASNNLFPYDGFNDSFDLSLLCQDLFMHGQLKPEDLFEELPLIRDGSFWNKVDLFVFLS